MSTDILLTLLICGFVIVCFVFQLLRVDLVAILIMASVSLLGLTTPAEAIEGFANPATITVMCMFILSESVSRTGALNVFSQKILNYSNGSKNKALILLLIFVGIVSMFINNTAAVALLIPVVLQLSTRAGWDPSHLLMPVSFASMAGGVCTLIGTSTNLLADSILKDHGYEGFDIFSFFKYGIVFYIISLVYLIVFSQKLIPSRRQEEDYEKTYDMNKYMTYILVKKGSKFIGEDIKKTKMFKQNNIKVFNKIKSEDMQSSIIFENDILFVETPLHGLKGILNSNMFDIVAEQSLDTAEPFPVNKSKIVEAVISPNSKLVNTKLPSADLFSEYGLKVLAVRHQGVIKHESLENFPLRAGDAILLYVPEENLERLRRSNIFVLITEPDLKILNTKKIPLALAILVGVVLLAAFNILSIYISALFGICAFILTKIIKIEDIYSMVNWRIIFLLAGLLALGKAMENSGAVAYIANFITEGVSGYGLTALVGVYFSLTIGLTSFISNNAAVVLLAPLAIHSANQIGVPVNTLVLPVMFAGSMSFLTPVGYQTNLMVYGIGQYKFKDFFVFGGPLCLICLIVALFIFT